MKQRFFRLLLAALLAAALTVPAGAAGRSVAVQVDARPLAAGGHVSGGVTYVPLRALLGALGGDWKVWWDARRGEAAAAGSSGSLRASPAADTITVAGRQYTGRVWVERGVTYVPLRTVCEALGCRVEWDPWLDGAAVTTPGAGYDAAELYWLARIICAESGGESMEGQIAVGNVIVNRVNSAKFPDTIQGVIFDRQDAVQFEPVANGRIYQTPTAQSLEAARRTLDGENVIGSALYFYAPALSQGVWINANCTYQQTIGCHRFYVD